MQIVERFVSINGEGAHAGEPTAFIRFHGCNLNCSYCDTRWANNVLTPTADYTPEQLAKWVRNKRVINVTLTGGEPLLQDELDELIRLLTIQGNRVEIETNGSIALDSLAHSAHRPVFTMDYKLPSSGMEIAMRKDNFRLLCPHDTVKFVAGTLTDLEHAHYLIEEHNLDRLCHVYLSPVYGKIDPAEIVRFMLENKMNRVRMQLQLHKFIWSPNKRGV